MNIRDLSEREILALQYSLLEELKHSNDNVAVISPNKEVTASLSKSFQNEKKTELLSARVKPTAKSIIEDSNYSYSDAIEYFAHKLIGNEKEITQNTLSAEEYIKQRFTDKEGNPENNDQYVCRLKWFELGCPKFNKFANKTIYAYQSIRNFSSRYNWKNIRAKAIELGYSHNKYYAFVDNTQKTVKRDSKEYNRFRESVLKRDGVCQCCGNKEDLEVHHTFPFHKYNSLGADTNNGITLCKECHNEYHSQFGYKKRNNPVTLAQFLRDYGMNPQTKLSDSFFDTHKGVVLEIIKRLQKEYGGDCPIKKLTPVLKGEWDLLEEDCDSFISSLIQKGLIYEPTAGYVKVVE